MSNKPINRTPAPVIMWAAIINGQRSAWIQPRAVRGTRKASREAFLDMWEPDCRKKRWNTSDLHALS